jgi:hypothetical protein
VKEQACTPQIADVAFELVTGSCGLPVAINQASFLGVSSQRKEICAVNFGFVFSLVLVILAVIGVFIEIPLVSNYAFWLAIGAYIMLAGTRA